MVETEKEEIHLDEDGLSIYYLAKSICVGEHKCGINIIRFG